MCGFVGFRVVAKIFLLQCVTRAVLLVIFTYNFGQFLVSIARYDARCKNLMKVQRIFMSIGETTPLGAIAKNEVSDSVRRARLMWRAKRGLLENDILMTRFFEAHPDLTDAQVYGLDLLLDLPDDELLGLIMSRKELKEVDPSEHIMNDDDMGCANEVLMMLRAV